MTPVATDRDDRWTSGSMRSLGDRRRRIRLEVVGSLWGVLDIERQAQLLNISRTGALIVSPVPAAVDSTQSVTLTVEGHEVTLDARVRHLQRLDEGPEVSYRIGLQFLEAPAILVHALE